MALDLSFDSDIDDELRSGSPVSPEDDVSEAESSSSLDALIRDFRSKSHKSSVASDNADDQPRVPPPQSLRYPSPPRSSKLKAANGGKSSFPGSRSILKPVTKPNNRVIALVHAASDESDRDEEEAVRPMPKLTQIPKPKPTLVQIPRSRLLEIPRPRPSLLIAPKRDPAPKTSKPIVPRSPSPKKKPRRPQAVVIKEKPRLSSPSPASSVASSSVVSEDIEPPDTLGDESIDNLIGHDLEELNRLISSGREPKQDATARKDQQKGSPTSEEMTTALRQSTRFRTNNVDRKPNELSKPPTSRLAFPTFKLQMPSRRKQIQYDNEDPPPPPPPEDNDDEDSFAKEILKLRMSTREQKESENKKNAKEQNSPQAKEISAETTENIREVSNTIDQVLLLALQPFEKRRKEMDTDDAAAAQENPPGLVMAMQNAALPLATQAIVENLDLAFGSMTQQRNAELKAGKDAEAAAKAVNEAAKKEADTKKLEAERAEKQRQKEILSLLPMRGKLLASSADVDDTLYRLELAETQASHTIHMLAGRATPKDDGCSPLLEAAGLEGELTKLRQRTMHRIQEIEHQLQQPAQVVSRVNWELAAFESEEQARKDNEEQLSSSLELIHGSTDLESFHDILQRQVVENLDLTMLKLRHVLSIDEKEATAAKETSEREAAAKHKKQLEEEREKARKQQEAEDAENARKRVMGLTSLDQLSSWVDETAQLQVELSDGRAVDRLISSLGIRTDTLHHMTNSSATSSGFNTRQALERFDAITEIMVSDKSERQHVPDVHDSDGEDRHQQQWQRHSTKIESPLYRRQQGHAAREQLEIDSSSDGGVENSPKLLKRVQFNHSEPEDDTPSFDTLFQRFHGASSPLSRPRRVAGYNVHMEQQSSPRQARRALHGNHEAPKQHAWLSTTPKAPSSTHALPPRRSNSTPSPVQQRSPYRSSFSTPHSSPPGRHTSRAAHHKPSISELATHPRKTASGHRNSSITRGSALVDRIQQQIASLQADRRQKNAWVSQRVA